jgi:hypothetical protein
VHRWPQWSPQITAVELAAPAHGAQEGTADGTEAGAMHGAAEGDRLRPGLRGVVRGPWGVAVPFTVTAVDERARTWSWRVSVGVLHLHLAHGVEADPAGTRTWLRVTGLLPLAAGYAPLARIALRRLVRP